ncbi:MAG: hypothetical protein LAC70_06805 [Methylovulum sp.]|jgi:hypothetical protein|nr:hypothetical protein [Methylovulum sp.]
MSHKKEKRGRKAIPEDQKKPPQPTIKINDALFPFVKLLKVEYKAKRVSNEKLHALTQLLLNNTDETIEKQVTQAQEDVAL